MRSMTGYGEASGELADWRLEVSCRGVNHRYLDVAIRLPGVCRSSEAAIQTLVGERLERGRIEVTIEVTPTAGAGSDFELRLDLAQRLAEAARQLAAEGIGQGDLRTTEVLAYPGILESRSSPESWGQEEEARLLEAVETALGRLDAARREEGSRLRQRLEEKLSGLEELLGHLEARRGPAQAALLSGLEDRLDELLSGRSEIDPERRAQEAALLAERTNITEEIERLGVHLEHFHDVLDQDGSLGKRLDFLVQEIFRELNTLGAKCRDTAMSRSCVDAKVLCEELREQLRNVE